MTAALMTTVKLTTAVSPLPLKRRPAHSLQQTFIKRPLIPSSTERTVTVMAEVETTSEWVTQEPIPGVGIPVEVTLVEVTLVEAPACHLCEDAKCALAVLARSYPLTVHVVSIEDDVGRELMRAHRAPMSPLVLLDGQYFSSGRLPRRKLEKRLAKAQSGEVDG